MSFDPYFTTGFHLETSKILMRAMEAEDVNNFLPLAECADIWKYFTKEFNRRRDSVYFSILRPEWPDIKRKFFADINL